MKTNSRFHAICLISLLWALLSLAGCGNPAPSGEINPIVDDPDLEINVTPKPEEKYAYFSIDVTRVGEQAPKIGWVATGEIYLRVTMGLQSELNITGTGFGTAGFDASSQICIDQGGWPINYAAEGIFDAEKCELKLKIEETWPQTEAYANCVGGSGSASGGMYKLIFPSLTFTDDDTREDTETTKDMITWMNTFQLYPKDGLEDTGCVFSAASP